jgi:cytokinin dehydrogenase
MSANMEHNRRSFIRAMSIGALVVGFDTSTRAWASGDGEGDGLDHLPHLDGWLVVDPAGLAPYADDFGHLVHRSPKAVLIPGSVADIATVIGFCGPRHIPVSPRGQGHQTYGQAQVAAGLVIDMGPLNTVTIDPASGTASVGAGAVWSAVLTAALAHGLTPPVFTDYVELSIGGTLSAGGLGGASHHHGAQVDTVVEIDVVTGTGDLVTCSASRHSDLFHAALSGLGQVGVITRATLRLVHAPASVRSYQITYPSVAAFTAAQRRVVRDGRFDWLEGAINAVPGGGWQYVLEGSAFYDQTPPNDAALLDGLGFEGAPQIQDYTYEGFVTDLAPAIAFLKSTGEWYDPHPWFNMFLPDDAIDSYVATVLANLTTADIGASGLVLLYPVPTAKLTAPLLRVPDSDLAFLFAVLRTASPDIGALPAATMLEGNRDLFLKAQHLGGTAYPVGAIPMTADDWRVQYGDRWQDFRTAKHRFDPHGILATGQGIFGQVD